MLTYEKMATLFNYVSTSAMVGLLGYGLKNVADFLFLSENLFWFCEHELRLNGAYAAVCSSACDVEKTPHSEIKKRMLLDVVNQYNERLMSLVAFMRYRSELLVPSSSLNEELLAYKATNIKNMISNLELFAHEFLQAINSLLSPAYKGITENTQLLDGGTPVKTLLCRMQNNMNLCLQVFKEFESLVKKKSSLL